MAEVTKYTRVRPNKLRTVETKDTDYTNTLTTYIRKSTAIVVTGAESLTLSAKSSVSSLVSILDAEATAYLGADVPVWTSSGTQLINKTLDLKAMALNSIIIKIDGQNGAPTIGYMLRVNYRG